MVLFSEKVKVAHLALIGAILIPQLHHKGTDKKHPGPSLNLIFSLSGSREWLTSCLKTKSCLHLLFYLLLIKERRGGISGWRSGMNEAATAGDLLSRGRVMVIRTK